MKKYAIIRVEKLKTFGAISASAQHCFRHRPTPNADPSKQNLGLGARKSEDVIHAIRERIAAVNKADKQAVPCLEYLVAASNEQPQAYFVDALNWLKQRHGVENVVSATIHNDETTRHMTVYIVPVAQVAETTRKRSVNKKGGGREVRTEVVPAHSILSAKKYTGGREVLSQMQTDFAAEVGAKYGLDRGVKREKTGPQVTHQAVKEWYQKKDDLLNDLVKEKNRLTTLKTALTEQERAVQSDKRSQDILQEVLQKKMAEIESQKVKLDKDREALDRTRAALDVLRTSLDKESAAVETRVREMTEAVRAGAVEQKKLFVEAYNSLPLEAKKEASKNEVVVAAIKKISPKKNQGVSM